MANPYSEVIRKLETVANVNPHTVRRVKELLARGEEIPFEDVLADQRLRDQRDLSRAVGALRKADDAIEVSTDGLTPDEVVARLEKIVRDRC